MDYKYFIRKISIRDVNLHRDVYRYVPMICINGDWKNLIYSSRSRDYMTSGNTKTYFETKYQALRFIGMHRMNRKNKGKCFYFDERLTLIPVGGLVYGIKSLFTKVNPVLLYSNPIIMGVSIFIQLLSLIMLMVAL